MLYSILIEIKIVWPNSSLVHIKKLLSLKNKYLFLFNSSTFWSIYLKSITVVLITIFYITLKNYI